MSAWLIALTGVIYVYVAGEELFARHYGMAIMYAGYAFANVGAWWMATEGTL